MFHGKKLFLLLVLAITLPLLVVAFSSETFRYPCQDPANWDTAQCQKPLCDVTRTCPEHIFKGQRDPRLGPPQDTPQAPTPVAKPQQGAQCK